MVAAVSTDATLWEYAEGAAIECSPALLQELRRAAVDGFVSFAHGGLETGGVLYGLREGDRLTIQASAELPCEHALGPGFVLSDNDRQALMRLLEPPEGLQTLGWYRAHTRDGLVLDAGDLELFERFFAGGKSVGLMLKPSLLGSATAAFFVRERTGEIQPPAAREFTIQAARAPRPVRPETSAVPVEPPRTPAADAGVARTLSRATARRGGLYAIAGAAALAIALFAFYPRPRPANGLALQVYALSPGQLRIQWDRKAQAVVEGRSASLQIRDGDAENLISLDANQLRLTTVTYVQKSSHVSVALRVQGSHGGGPAEEFAEFIDAAQSAVQAHPAPVAPAQASADRSSATPAPAEQASRPKVAPSRRARHRSPSIASFDPIE